MLVYSGGTNALAVIACADFTCLISKLSSFLNFLMFNKLELRISNLLIKMKVILKQLFTYKTILVLCVFFRHAHLRCIYGRFVTRRRQILAEAHKTLILQTTYAVFSQTDNSYLTSKCVNEIF